MTYPAAIRYLESFLNYEKTLTYPYNESLKLERVRGFLEFIGSPQDSLSCIHVAGTKGKGSTCAYITYILREAGFKVGLYTSPHLVDFRERIRILAPSSQLPAPSRDFEGMIAKRKLAALAERLRPALDEYHQRSEYGPLSFFEVYTSLAFVYFKEKKVDFAVLETGLGGRLDATNVVNPLAAVITPISYEHTDKLGNTLREIAGEKAGIIKNCRGSWVVGRGLTVVSAPQEKEALTVIRDRCRDAGARLCEIKNSAKVSQLKTRLIGRHQLVNAAVAMAAVEVLGDYGIKVSAAAIKKGLHKTVWPGRCEVILKRPLIVLDGAQNAASAKALAQAVKSNFKYKNLILVLGISADKDIAGICRQLCPLADRIILTQADNPRAASVEQIESIVLGLGSWVLGRIVKTESVRDASLEARKIAGKDDLILVTGSLFVVGEFRQLWIRSRRLPLPLENPVSVLCA